MAEVLEITDATFDREIMQSDQPVLVDFWAEWCAPCRALAPVIKELAGDYDGRLKVAKVDADANPATAAELQVRALPTLLFIKNGTVAAQMVGRQPKDKIAAQIDELLI